MGSGALLHSHRAVTPSSCFLTVVAAALAAAFVAGCGGSSGGSNQTGPTLSGYTAVTVLAASTANDQLSRYSLTLNSLTLSSQSGKTVMLLTAPQSAEFIHVNGSVEPLSFASIPQDVYVSATATVQPGGPTCIGQSSTGGLLIDSAIGFGPTKASDVTVNLPAPITITGTSMGLTLNLQVSKSVSAFSCVSTSLDKASITPNFTLTPVVVAAQPASAADGEMTGLRGLISSVNSAGEVINVAAGDGPDWPVAYNSSTVFQGISGASQLAVGLPVDMDVAIQAHGPMLARRVAVYDTNPEQLSAGSGPLLTVAASEPVLLAFARESQGAMLPGLAGNALYFSFGNAVFQTSSQLTNLQSLPFNASFNAANMVGGQNVFVTTHATALAGGPTYIPAATVTLIPQTINGTVRTISTQGNFTAYTVQLASYDLLPNLAEQAGQTTLLPNPNTVVVYADSNTQKLTTNPIAVGSVVRFYGLVFNDNGTLRMDCAQINDGVAL